MWHPNTPHQENPWLWVNLASHRVDNQDADYKEVICGDQDMEIDVEDGNDNDNDSNTGDFTMHSADDPKNPEAALIEKLKRLTKNPNKSPFSNEIKSAMAEFLYAEHLLDGHPHHGCRQKILDHEYSNDKLGMYGDCQPSMLGKTPFLMCF